MPTKNIKFYHLQLDPERRLAMRILDRVFSVIALSLKQGKKVHARNINDIYKYQKYPSPCTKIFATRNELQQHSPKLQKDIAINGNDYETYTPDKEPNHVKRIPVH